MFEDFEKLVSSVAEKEHFRVAANKLLNQCFLLKKKEDTRKDYIFVRENKELFKTWRPGNRKVMNSNKQSNK